MTDTQDKFSPGDTVKHKSGKRFRYGVYVEKVDGYDTKSQCYRIGKYGYCAENLVLVEEAQADGHREA